MKTNPYENLYLVDNNIKSLRLQSNLKQEALACILKKCVATISKIENNEQELTLSQAVTIANYFKISLDTLFVNPLIKSDKN